MRITGGTGVFNLKQGDWGVGGRGDHDPNLQITVFMQLGKLI
jgi:hypothetical protein